jgi:hypothetical protein
VDVLCAVECVRQAKRIFDGNSEAEAVLVLSQDIDLKPGVALALDFDVPVLAVSPGAIHNRGVPFIAISEASLAELVNAEGAVDVHGQSLRQRLATAADRPGVDSWEFRYTQRVGRETIAVLRHRHGYEGVADPEIIDRQVQGELYNLGIMGIATGLRDGFPKALLGLDADRSDDLLTGTVVGRFSLFRAKVGVHGTTKQVSVDVSNSYLTPGTQVLLHDPGRGARARFVGALGDPPPMIGAGGKEMPAVSVVATATETRKSHAYAWSETDEIEIFLPSGAGRTKLGGRYLVSLVAGGRDKRAPFVGHLASTRLP